MARRKPLNRYPQQYWDVFMRAQKTSFYITTESSNRARSLRSELYNFRSVVKASEELTIAQSRVADEIDSVVIEVKGAKLHMHPRRENSFCGELDEALEATGG